MNTNDSNPGPWWRRPWPWFLMSLPATAVVASIITIWLATRDADSLVSDDYYKEGLAIHQVLERDAKAKALGIAADLTVEDMRIQVELTGQMDAPPSTLTLHMTHPTRAEQDKQLVLHLGPDGHHTATLPTKPSGIWKIMLEPADRSWRLTGEWRSPFTGHIALRP